MAKDSGFSMNGDLAAKPSTEMTWDELLHCGGMKIRVQTVAEFEGLAHAKAVVDHAVDVISKAADEISKLPGINVVASTDSGGKLAHDFRDAAMRDFFKTQVRAPINAALIKLADALVPHVGGCGVTPAEVLRGAAKAFEDAQREADNAAREAAIRAQETNMKAALAGMKESQEKFRSASQGVAQAVARCAVSRVDCGQSVQGIVTGVTHDCTTGAAHVDMVLALNKNAA